MTVHGKKIAYGPIGIALLVASAALLIVGLATGTTFFAQKGASHGGHGAEAAPEGSEAPHGEGEDHGGEAGHGEEEGGNGEGGHGGHGASDFVPPIPMVLPFLGILIVVIVSAAQVWTPVLDPWVPFVAPLIGGAIGLLSGTYPAMRAANLEPVEAIRIGG